MILMTIELDEHIPKYSNQKEVTNLVEKHLINLWSVNVSEDQIKPLFTRIANNVVFVK